MRKILFLCFFVALNAFAQKGIVVLHSNDLIVVTSLKAHLTIIYTGERWRLDL